MNWIKYSLEVQVRRNIVQCAKNIFLASGSGSSLFFRHFSLLLLLRGGFLRAAALLCLQCTRERRRTHALLLRRRRCRRGRCRGWPSGERRDLAPFPRLRRTFSNPLARARRSQERRRVRHLGFKASLWVV